MSSFRSIGFRGISRQGFTLNAAGGIFQNSPGTQKLGFGGEVCINVDTVSLAYISSCLAAVLYVRQFSSLPLVHELVRPGPARRSFGKRLRSCTGKGGVRQGQIQTLNSNLLHGLAKNFRTK